MSTRATARSALHSVSINARETVALLGTNGNGKSTLMKCVMGWSVPTKGSVFLTIDNQRHDLTKLSTEDIVNLGGDGSEGRRLFPKLTVEENLLLGAFHTPGARDSKDMMFEYSPSGRTTSLAGLALRRAAADARHRARA